MVVCKLCVTTSVKAKVLLIASTFYRQGCVHVNAPPMVGT